MKTKQRTFLQPGTSNKMSVDRNNTNTFSRCHVASNASLHPHQSSYGHIIKLLIITGQRREEVAGMRWDELDLTNNTWTIARDRNKSDREHSVPLSPQSVQIIKSIPAPDLCIIPQKETPTKNITIDRCLWQAF
jgi:hypothetical protein